MPRERDEKYLKQLAANKRWADNNKERVKETKSRYYKKNKKYYLDYSKEWRGKNPEKYKTQIKNRKYTYVKKCDQPISERESINRIDEGIESYQFVMKKFYTKKHRLNSYRQLITDYRMRIAA